MLPLTARGTIPARRAARGAGRSGGRRPSRRPAAVALRALSVELPRELPTWPRSIPREGVMVRSVADRAFLPTKNLLEEVGDMMILTGKTIMSALRPPYPYGGEFVSQFLFALRLCWFPLLVSTVAFGYGAPGLQAANFLVLFGALDRLGGFFVLASIREFAPVRDRDRAGRRGGHRDHRRPRRAQDPRGARRPAGAGRRPDQEPRRAALPGADDRHRPVRHLRAAVRHLRRRAGHARQRRAAGAVLGDVLLQRLDHRPVGLGAEDARCSGRSSRSSAVTRG